MRFFRCLTIEVRSVAKVAIPWAVFLSVFSAALIAVMQVRIRGLGLGSERITVGDCLLYLTFGSPAIELGLGTVSMAPVDWLVWIATMLFAASRDGIDEGRGIGSSLLVACGSRLRWWLVRCVASIVGVTILCLIVWASSCAVGMLCGATADLGVSEGACSLAGFSPDNIDPLGRNEFAVFMLSVLVMLAALSILRLALSELGMRALSVVIVLAVVCLAVWIPSDLLPGAYLMLSRSSCAVMGGVQPYAGLCYAGIVGAISMGIGAASFAQRDIVGGGERS